jgi:hypothetical protein
MMSEIKISGTGHHFEKRATGRWRRPLTALAWMAGILLLGGCATAVGLFLAEHETDLTAWLHQIRGPLFLWRLALYAVVAAMWLHRVRAALLRQASSPWTVYRLEVMMVCLALLIEFTSYRWGM